MSFEVVSVGPRGSGGRGTRSSDHRRDAAPRERGAARVRRDGRRPTGARTSRRRARRSSTTTSTSSSLKSARRTRSRTCARTRGSRSTSSTSARRGYRFKGTARIVEAPGEVVGSSSAGTRAGLRLRARGPHRALRPRRTSIWADELTSPAYDWGSTEESSSPLRSPLCRRMGAPAAGGLAAGDLLSSTTWPTGRLPRLGALGRRSVVGRPPPGRSRRPFTGRAPSSTSAAPTALLMESVVEWAAFPVEPYGLDYAPQLVAEARRRLPQLGRPHLGRRRARLGAAAPVRLHPYRAARRPEERRREHVERLLGFVAPGGRLIVCGYGGTR